MAKKWTAVLVFVCLFATMLCGCSQSQPTASQPAASQPAASQPAAPQPAATGDPGTTAPAKEYKIRFSFGWQPTSSAGLAMNDWAELVQEYSNGQITVEVFPGGQLYKFSETVEALQSGMIEVAGISEPNLENNVKIVGLSQIPGIVTDDDQANRVVHNPEFRAMYNGAIEDALKIVMLGNFANMRAIESYVIIGTGNPILEPADLKGRVVRVAAPSQAEIVTKNGGVPSSIAGSEFYMAMQRGTVEAICSDADTFLSRKIYETADWVVPSNLHRMGSLAPVLLGMNQDYFDSLPADLQQVLRDASDEVDKRSWSYTVYPITTMDDLVAASGGKLQKYDLTSENAALWLKEFQPKIDELLKDPDIKKAYDIIMQEK